MTELAGGHDAALNALMERHAQKLFHYLVRSLQDQSDATDLAQEMFAKVYQSRARFDPKQKFTTWLYAIASNLETPRPANENDRGRPNRRTRLANSCM